MSFSDINTTNGFGSINKKPIDSTNLGIIKNTITGLPRATVSVFSDMIHGITRNLASAGLTLMGKESLNKPQTETQKKIYNTLYGDRDIKNLQTRIAESEINIQKSPFAKKYGIDKYALPLAFGGVLADVGIDLSMFGSSEKAAIKTLAKEKNVDNVFKILKDMKISDGVAREFAPKIAETTDKGEIKDALSLIKKTEVLNTMSNIPEEKTAVNKIIDILKETKPLRGKQEKLYTEERTKRMFEALNVEKKGQSGYYEQLSKLKGEMGKINYEPITSKLKQEDIDSLFTQIQDNPALTFWDSVTARNGLSKILEGRLPTENEIKLLNKTFPKEFADAVLSNRTLFEKIKTGVLEVINIPRAIMSSFDLSAPFRQGLFMVNRPKQFWGSFSEMIKSFGSEGAYKELQKNIINNPLYKTAVENKLSLTDLEFSLTSREEQFMSNLAEKIPGIGNIVRGSGRAYTGFLNKVRMDVFADLYKKAETQGLNPKENAQLVSELAKFINSATGRGSLAKTAFGNLERSAVALNSFFFSPRLMASRLTLLNPVYYIKAEPFVRKEALKSLLTVAGAGLTILQLAKLGGAEVSDNPTSADFGKIKIGDTRIDIWGGFQQYVVAAARLLTGKYTSTVSNETSKLGEGYKAKSRYDILLSQIESKESPIMSFITQMAKQKDAAGNAIQIPKKVMDLFTPMTVGSLIEIAKDDPKLLPTGLLGIFGFGVQTYQNTGKGMGAGTTNSGGFGSVKNSGFSQ